MSSKEMPWFSSLQNAERLFTHFTSSSQQNPLTPEEMLEKEFTELHEVDASSVNDLALCGSVLSIIVVSGPLRNTSMTILLILWFC